MKTTQYDEREVTEWLYRLAPPALAWAALFAYFALGGTSSRDEPRQMADVAPAVQLMANATAGVPALVQNAPSAREPARRDAAVVAHEALDPVSGSLSARTCSGGADGGIDATGNQCSDASTIGAYAKGSEIAILRPTATLGGIKQSIAAPVVMYVAATMSTTPAKTAASTQGAGRIAKAAPPPIARVETSKIEIVDASTCSGGADGGMDATGNQCSEHRWLR